MVIFYRTKVGIKHIISLRNFEVNFLTRLEINLSH